MANKIVYLDKVKVRDSVLPKVNKGTADDFNEIKAVVNSHADEIDTNASDIADKQDALESGVNIKTINGESLLGGGDIEINSSSLATDNQPIPDATTREVTLGAGSTLLVGGVKHFEDGRTTKKITDTFITDPNLIVNHLTTKLVNSKVIQARYNDDGTPKNVVFEGVTDGYVITKANGSKSYYDTFADIKTNAVDGDIIYVFQDETISVDIGFNWTMPNITIFQNGHTLTLDGLATGSNNFIIGAGKIVHWYNGTVVSSVTANTNNGFNIALGGKLISDFTLNTYNSALTGYTGSFAINNAGEVYNVRMDSPVLLNIPAYTGNGKTFNCYVDNYYRALVGGNHFNINVRNGELIGANTNQSNIDFILETYAVSGGTHIKTKIKGNTNDGDGLVYRGNFYDCDIERTGGTSGNAIISNTDATNTIFEDCRLTNSFGRIIHSNRNIFIKRSILTSLSYNVGFAVYDSLYIEDSTLTSTTEDNVITAGAATNLRGTFKNVTFNTPIGKVALNGVSTKWFDFVDCKFTEGRALSTTDLIDSNPQRLLDCSDAHGNTGLGLVSKFPKMTETERDALSGVGKGYTIENTTANELQTYNGTIWKTLLDLS